MLLDTDQSFGQIDKGSKTVKQQLLELQDLMTDANQQHEWAASLRFLTRFRGDDGDVVNAYAVPDQEDEAEDEEMDVDEGEENAEHGDDAIDEGSDESGDPNVESDIVTGDLQSSLHSSSGLSVAPCPCEQWKLFLGPGPINLKLEQAGSATGCTDYVAVSYCWQSHLNDSHFSGTSDQPAYTVYTLTGARPSKAPPEILQRAISYAARVGSRCIWIDQECISQDDRDEKEKAIQSMDLVYHRTRYPLGLLEFRIEHQQHMDIFEHLYEGKLIEYSEMPNLAELLAMLEHEIWFSRAWILQESTAGGLDMQLLLRHEPTLSKSSYFGDIVGELQISILELQTSLTWADTCVDQWTSKLSRDLHESLTNSLKKLWTFLPTLVPESPESIAHDPDYRQTCNAAQALAFLQDRRNDRLVDRLAILGNLCNYPKRLDTMQVEASEYSFTVCVLALAAFNGDPNLFTGYKNTESLTPVAWGWTPPAGGRLSNRSYVEENEHILRYSVGHLTARGLPVRGRLWKIYKSVDLDMVQSQFLEPWMSERMHDLNDVGAGSAMALKAAFIWCLIKTLVLLDLKHLASVIWNETRKRRIWRDDYSPQLPSDLEIPSNLFDVIDSTSAELTLRLPPVVKGEADYQELFIPGRYNNLWQLWIIRHIMEHGCLSYGHLVTETAETRPSSLAIFALVKEGLVFVPATQLDDLISHGRNPQPQRDIGWCVNDLGVESCSQGMATVLNCKSRVKGYWSVAENERSTFYVLS